MNIAEFQNLLMQWYKKEARVLPWRSDPTPYKVWISEIMLQQTRVDTVIPYFLRFIEEVPSVAALAQIEEEKLLKLWQGLGYYNRALNLKKAGLKVIEEFNGEIPSEMEDLMSLPGIGVYTAGAIASIAFGKAVPAVDGNVLRIIARVTASREDISSPATKKVFEPLALQLIPKDNPGDFNQALMDLGATICLSNGEPKCNECPVNSCCEAYRKDLTFELPVQSAKKPRKILKKTVFVISYKDSYALKKRPAKGLLANLWEFPNVEGHLNAEQGKQALNSLGLAAFEISKLPASKHIFTHLEWHMKSYLVKATELQASSDLTWATKEEINHRYSIPTAFKKVVADVEGIVL